MRRLVFAEGVRDAINEIVYAVDGVETGVRLVGIRQEDCFVIRHVIGPGEKARLDVCNYQCDNAYAETVFTELLDKDPTLEWLGELHVHPPGCPWLSRLDRKTIREVVLGTDDALHPEEFIAGVMLRVDGAFVVDPFVFTKENLNGERLEVEYGKYICTESTRTGSTIRDAFRFCRDWQRRKHHRRHGS